MVKSFDNNVQKRNDSFMHYISWTTCQQYSLCIISNYTKKIKVFFNFLY